MKKMLLKTFLFTFILFGLIINSICSPTSNSQSSNNKFSKESCCNGANNLYPTQVKSSSYRHQQKAVNSFLKSVDNSEIFTPEWMNSKPDLRPSYQQLGMFRCAYSSCAGKAFPTQHELVRHSIRHTDERPFRCEICGDTFKGNDALMKHIKNLHQISAEKPLQCKFCGASYKSASNLRLHLDVHKKQ